jgi:hypothetical protein
MIEQAKRISLFLRTLWYLISWAFVAFAIVAVFFLGLLPVLVQPLMEDALLQIGRTSDTARLRYITPFYAQVDHFGYQTPAFALSTEKVAVDMSPSDWLNHHMGVINVTGYELDLDFDHLKKYHLDSGFQKSFLQKPVEDFSIMFLAERMYVKDALVCVTAGDLHQDYTFNFFSRLHSDGHFFSLQTADISKSKYKINGYFSPDLGSGNLTLNGSEQSPELWLNALKVYTWLNVPLDITFDHGVDFEAQIEFENNLPEKWTVLGWLKGLNLTGRDFSVVINNLSIGSTGAKDQYLKTSAMGDVGRSMLYGYDLGPFNFELAQNNNDICLDIPSLRLNQTTLNDLSVTWSISDLEDAMPEKAVFTMEGALIQLEIQNANELKHVCMDAENIDLSFLSDLVSDFLDIKLNGKGTIHFDGLINRNQLIVKELKISFDDSVEGSVEYSGSIYSVDIDSLLLEKSGGDVYLKTSGELNNQPYSMDQSVLHFIPVLQKILSQKGMQLMLD